MILGKEGELGLTEFELSWTKWVVDEVGRGRDTGPVPVRPLSQVLLGLGPETGVSSGPGQPFRLGRDLSLFGLIHLDPVSFGDWV